MGAPLDRAGQGGAWAWWDGLGNAQVGADNRNGHGANGHEPDKTVVAVLPGIQEALPLFTSSSYKDQEPRTQIMPFLCMEMDSGRCERPDQAFCFPTQVPSRAHSGFNDSVWALAD